MAETPDLDALARMLEKATAGPWAIESCGEKGDGSNMIGVVFDPTADPDCKRPLSGWLPACREDGEFIEYYVDEAVAECEHRNRNSGADATLIAALRNAAPWLIEQARRTARVEEALRGLMVVVGTVGLTGHRKVDVMLEKRIAAAEAALAAGQPPEKLT